MLLRSRAIVLYTLPYGDDKMICRLLTEQEGCVPFIVRRSRAKASRHRIFQPLALLEVEWNKPKGDTLVRPKSVTALEPYLSIPYEAGKTSVALFLCEFLNAALRSEPPATPLFRFVEHSLRLYDRLEREHANFHLVFLLQLASFIGLQPDVASHKRGAYFDLRESRFTTILPPHTEYIPPEEAEALPQLMRMSYANMRYFRLSGAQRSSLLKHLLTYYQLHIPSFPMLKSLDVLREVWGKNN